MPPDFPSISIRSMLIVLPTIKYILDPMLCFLEDNTSPPPSNQLSLILPPLTKILKETLIIIHSRD